MLREETRVLTDDVIFEVASNGTRVIDTIIKNRTYMSEFIHWPTDFISNNISLIYFIFSHRRHNWIQN